MNNLHNNAISWIPKYVDSNCFRIIELGIELNNLFLVPSDSKNSSRFVILEHNMFDKINIKNITEN